MSKKKKNESERKTPSEEAGLVEPKKQKQEGVKPKPKWEKVYQSNWCQEKVTLPQFLAETLVARKAAWLRTKLTPRWWQDKEWATEFKAQITHVNRALKRYPSAAVVEAVNQNKWCFSLGNPKVLAAIASKARTIQTIAETLYPEQEAEPIPLPSGLPETAPTFISDSNKSTLDKIKEMENQ